MNRQEGWVTYIDVGIHETVICAASFHLTIHSVDLAETRCSVWNGRVDFSLSIEGFQSCLLSLHVQSIIHLVINTELLIKLSGSFTFEPREHRRFVLIELSESQFLYGIARYTSVISYYVMLSSQAFSFNTPAILPRHSSD